MQLAGARMRPLEALALACDQAAEALASPGGGRG
jgi:hypothetical protein